MENVYMYGRPDGRPLTEEGTPLDQAIAETLVDCGADEFPLVR